MAENIGAGTVYPYLQLQRGSSVNISFGLGRSFKVGRESLRSCFPAKRKLLRRCSGENGTHFRFQNRRCLAVNQKTPPQVRIVQEHSLLPTAITVLRHRQSTCPHSVRISRPHRPILDPCKRQRLAIEKESPLWVGKQIPSHFPITLLLSTGGFKILRMRNLCKSGQTADSGGLAQSPCPLGARLGGYIVG